MTSKKPRQPAKPSPPDFIRSAFGFFSNVLNSFSGDNTLRLLWGVEVLLFAILALMILFGDVTVNQRFSLALAIAASVVVTFLISAWRMHGALSEPQRGSAGVRGDDAEVVESGRKCLGLMTQVSDANARILRRAQTGTGPWGRLMKDTYNDVCNACYQRRLGNARPDAYLDALAAEPDVDQVCKAKWLLGETLEDYRSVIQRASPPPKDHDALEKLIRRSITQPNLTPGELDAGLAVAIAQARRVLKAD
jgi:hypothetical protein